MVDISDMLFIVGHVGHIWRSWETKLYETITKSKVFETNTTTFSRTIFLRSLLRLFLRQKFSRPILRLFSRPKFSRLILRLFFETKYFRDRYRDFFFETKYFRDQYRDFFSRPKLSRPRPILSKNWEKSRYREVSRRDVTLWWSLVKWPLVNWPSGQVVK